MWEADHPAPRNESFRTRLAWLFQVLSILDSALGWVALSVLLGTATVASGIGLIATSAYLISAAALHPSIAVLDVAIVGVRFFGLSRGILRYLERLASHSANFRLLARLRVWLYARIEPLSPAVLMKASSGDLLSRLVTDVDALEDFYVRGMAPPLVALLVLVGMSVFLGSFDFRLAYLLAAFFLLEGVALPAGIYLLGKGPERQKTEEWNRLQVLLVDGIQGLADILSFGREATWLQQTRSIGQAYARAQNQAAAVRGVQTALSSLAADLGMLAVLAGGILLVAEGKIDGVVLAVLVLATLASFEAVAPLPAAAQTLERSLQAARRLSEISGQRAAVVDPPVPLPQPQQFFLECRDLSFSYDPPLAGHPATGGPITESQSLDHRSVSCFALHSISFRLEPGRRIAFVGPSGAGKTTLVNLLARFWSYDQGQILLGGSELRAYDQEDIHRWIGILPQAPYLFDTTMCQNLLLANRTASQAQIETVVHRVGLGHLVDSLPERYDTWVGEHGLRLSGGERQRVAIARLLLQDVPILVLDEPGNHLDPVSEEQIRQAIFGAGHEKSLLWITHHLVGMEDFDEILVMQAGRIVERGTHADLWQANGLYRRMWEMQQRNFLNFPAS